MVKPYYERDGIQLFLGDCREVLPTLPKDSVDVIVTDPPYGQGWQSGRRAEKFEKIEGDDGSLDVLHCLSLALKSLRSHRHVYCFGPADLSVLPIGGTTELVWDKSTVGLGNLTLPWAPQHERIAFGVFVPSKANRASGDGKLAARLRRGSVIRCQRYVSGQVSLHPTEKPVLLLRQLIESSSVMGETVLDPFVGSGATLEAALLEGRRAIGIELDEGYCEKAANRLSKLSGFAIAS